MAKIKKTEVNKMLKGLSKVNVENFANYLQETGVIVEPHIGRLRKKFSVPKELMGIKGESEFFSEYINKGNFSLLSKDEENALASIESSVRSTVKKLSIGYDGKYMPINIYKDEYAPYFEEKKEKYFSRRDLIVSHWDETIATFKSKFEEFLNSKAEDLSSVELDSLKDSVYKNIPSKENFKNSFYMDLSLSAFPVVSNLSILDESISDDVKDSIIRNSISTLYEILGNLMSDAFKSVNSVLAYYNENGELSKRYKCVISDLSKRLSKNNILKHAVIDEIVKDLKKLETEEDEDAIIETCEIIMAKIYGFAHQIKVEDFIDFEKSEMNVPLLHTIYTSLEPVEL